MDRKDYKYIYNSLNKNGSDRNFNYPIYIRNKEVATQEWVGKVIEGNIGANYLTKTEANILLSSKSDKDHTHKEYLTDVAIAVTTGSKTVGGNASTTGLYDGERYVYSLSGTENIGLGVNFWSWHPGEGTESMDCSYDSSTGILSWTLTTLVKGGPVSGSITWSGNNDTIKTTKNGTENVVGYFNRINGKSIVSTTGSTDFEFYTNEKIDEKLRWKANTSDIPTKTSQLTNDSGYITSYTDTKNTAGSTDTSSQIFLIGATSQSTNPQTYSHDTAYVGTDGCLYSNNTKVSVEGHTHSQYLTANDIANKADKADTLAGYGITDAYTKKDADLRFVPGISGDENNNLKGGIGNTGKAVEMSYTASNQNREFGSILMEDAIGSDPFYIQLKTVNNYPYNAKQDSELLVASDQAGIVCTNNENNQVAGLGAGLFDPNNENNAHNNCCAYLSATDGEISKFLTVTPTSATINNEEIATQTWVQNQLGGSVIDAYTREEVDTKLNLKANLDGGNTFNGLQTINAPTNVGGSEQATVKIKTANGGAIVLGKEGSNSGTMLRLDQKDGTCRLRFRSSATAGAMVWEQPEQGAKLYIDLGKDGADKHRISFPSSAGTLALKSQIPTVNNGTLTIQKNGTNVQTFTANQSENVTANITVPTKVSELSNDSGYLTEHQDISGKADKAKTLSGYGITDAYTKTEVDNKLSSKSNTDHTHGNITKDGLLTTADQVVVTDSNKKITSVAKGTAFNKNFGTAAGTVSEGNHTHDDVYVKGPSSATNNNIAIFDGETGKLIKTSMASIIDNQTLSILTRLSFRNRENSSIEMMSNGKNFYLQSFQGKIYLGSTLNTSTYWDADGVARFQALPNVKGKNVSLEGHTHTASEITDFPTIPTVNNATLTIQKNGTNVATFTANSSTNTTANITVPTKTSELTNDSGFLTSNPDMSIYATKTELESYLPLSGGTLTGNLSGKYITGTWLQTTAATDLGSAPPKYGVISDGGWLYTRTLAETKSDLGVPTKTSELTNDSGFIKTPHPTYYLHTISAQATGSEGSYLVFSVISTLGTAYSKSSLYNSFKNKNIHASGFYSVAKAANRVNAVTPKSATTIQIDYGNNFTVTVAYGTTFFTDQVRQII